LSSSLPLWSDKNTDPKHKNVKAFHHYGTRATIEGRDSYTRFLIREDNNGQIHYDHDSTSVEVFDAKEKSKAHHPPDWKPNPGEDEAGLAKN